MDESLLVHGAPDLKMPKPGRNAHGVRSLGNNATVLAIAECFVGGDKAAQLAVEAAMSAHGQSNEVDGFERVRDAILCADEKLRELGTDRCAIALVAVQGGRAWVAWTGPIRILLVRGKSIVYQSVDNKQTVGGPKGGSPPEVHTAETVWPLEQSDRLLMWTSPIFECVEETLLPNLLENRPPDRCIESVLKLANYRGLKDDYAMLVAAWQDPALATFAEGFRADVNYDDATTGGHLVREGFPEEGVAILTGDEFTAEPTMEREPVPEPTIDEPLVEEAPKGNSSSIAIALVLAAVVVCGGGAIGAVVIGAYFLLF